jgi:uncharacterized membrane protein
MKRPVVLGSVIVLMLLGFALRFYRLNAVPLRGDEAFTVIHWMREPLAQTLANIATVDPQAPLSYALYRGWGLLMGTSESIARILPALLSVIGIPVLYALGHRLRGWRFGLLAAFLWAIHPYQIWHAQDARNYAIWVVLSPLAIWLALRALDKQRRVDWLLYVIAGALAAYVYYLELFVLVVLNLYVFVTRWRERRLLMFWIGSQIAIAVILAPWYLQARLLFGSGYGGTAGGFDAQQWWMRFIPTLIFGGVLPPERMIPPELVNISAPLLMVVLLVGLVLWGRRSWHQAMLFGLLGTIPLILLGIVSTRLNVFEPRYVLAAAPAYTLIIGMLVFELRWRVLSIALVSVVVLISLLSLLNLYYLHDYAKSPNWRSLAEYLRDHVAPNDWVTQASADMSFIFYCGEYHITSVCNDQLPANPNQRIEEIERLLTIRNSESDSIWYVAQPPNWQNASTAEDWLTANMQQVRSTSTDGLRIQQFKPWQVTAEETGNTALVRFDDVVELVGVQSFIEPTDELTVWLYWHPLKTTDMPLKIFLHLTDADGIVSQDDQFPQDEHISTISWEAGEVYRDVFMLPLTSVPAGDYSLMVGFYDPETNRRLPVEDGDSFIIKMLSIP